MESGAPRFPEERDRRRDPLKRRKPEDGVPRQLADEDFELKPDD